MNTIKKYFAQAFAFLLIAGAISSCTSMDEGYKDFINDGEISYTGKIDSLHIYSGKNRVKVEGLIISDPKVSEVRIFWNNRRDSVVEPINRTAGVDQLSVVIPNLVENIYNFEVFTYDKIGNRSVAVSQIGITYGVNYEATLTAAIMNRKVVLAQSTGANLSVTFEALNDFTKTSVYSKLVYTATDETQKELLIQTDKLNVAITDYKTGTEIKYSTAYKPNVKSIDVFYTAEMSFATQTDVTNTYLTNPGFETNPTGAATDNTIYDVPGWTESPAAGAFTYKKLATIAYGSSTTALGTAPAITAVGGTALLGVKQHWLDASPKLYIEQTVTLPAGKYTLTWQSIVSQIATNATSLMGYEMDGLPVYDAFPTALDKWKDNSLVFVVSTPKKVTFRMGYEKTGNVGAAASPILFMDNLKLLYSKL